MLQLSEIINTDEPICDLVTFDFIVAHLVTTVDIKTIVVADIL